MLNIIDSLKNTVHYIIEGVQETIVKCVSKVNGDVVADKNCVEAQSIPSERKVCNDKNCPQR